MTLAAAIKDVSATKLYRSAPGTRRHQFGNVDLRQISTEDRERGRRTLASTRPRLHNLEESQRDTIAIDPQPQIAIENSAPQQTRPGTRVRKPARVSDEATNGATYCWSAPPPTRQITARDTASSAARTVWIVPERTGGPLAARPRATVSQQTRITPLRRHIARPKSLSTPATA